MLQVFIRRIRPLAPVLALSALGLFVPTSPGQCQIAPEIVRSSADLTGAQRDAVKEFVACATPGLSAPEPLKIVQARQMLLEPLHDAQVSVPFRLEFSRQIEAILAGLATDKRDIVAINALLVAGELATDQGLTIAEKQLANPDPAVRYETVHAISLSLEAVSRTAPALRAERLDRALSALGRQLAAEQDPHVIDALARAIGTGVGVAAPGLESVRHRALSELSTRCGARLKGLAGKPLDAALFETALTAGTTVRNALAGQAGVNRLPEQSITDACGFAGDMLASISRLLTDKNEPLPPIGGGDSPEDAAAKTQTRVLPSQVATVAETILSIAEVKSPVLDNPAKRLGDLLKSARPQDDAAFLDGVQQLVGPDGELHKQKGFKPDRFLP